MKTYDGALVTSLVRHTFHRQTHLNLYENKSSNKNNNSSSSNTITTTNDSDKIIITTTTTLITLYITLMYMYSLFFFTVPEELSLPKGM